MTYLYHDSDCISFEEWVEVRTKDKDPIDNNSLILAIIKNSTSELRNIRIGIYPCISL